MDGNAENLLTSIDFFQSLKTCAGAECSEQLKEAAVYYLQVRKDNPSAKITFTGHSLGGGLAALLAVFFNLDAVVFDEAPFRASANVRKNGNVSFLLAKFAKTFRLSEPNFFSPQVSPTGVVPRPWSDRGWEKKPRKVTNVFLWTTAG